MIPEASSGRQTAAARRQGMESREHSAGRRKREDSFLQAANTWPTFCLWEIQTSEFGFVGECCRLYP